MICDSIKIPPDIGAEKAIDNRWTICGDDAVAQMMRDDGGEPTSGANI
jgi:hypothetical protein